MTSRSASLTERDIEHNYFKTKTHKRKEIEEGGKGAVC